MKEALQKLIASWREGADRAASIREDDEAGTLSNCADDLEALLKTSDMKPESVITSKEFTNHEYYLEHLGKEPPFKRKDPKTDDLGEH